jgi:hypothetical protein
MKLDLNEISQLWLFPVPEHTLSEDESVQTLVLTTV